VLVEHLAQGAGPVAPRRPATGLGVYGTACHVGSSHPPHAN
jgi:hypothetical protein